MDEEDTYTDKHTHINLLFLEDFVRYLPILVAGGTWLGRANVLPSVAQATAAWMSSV